MISNKYELCKVTESPVIAVSPDSVLISFHGIQNFEHSNTLLLFNFSVLFFFSSMNISVEDVAV